MDVNVYAKPGRYQYVKIDLSTVKHVKIGAPMYLKNPDQFEVTPEPIGPFMGLSIVEMDIDDTIEYPSCTWPRWIAWLWKMFHRVQKYQIGPLRYCFICTP